MTTYILVDDNQNEITMKLVSNKNGVMRFEEDSGPYVISAEQWVDDLCEEISASGSGVHRALDALVDAYDYQYKDGYIREEITPTLFKECIKYFNELRLEEIELGNEFGNWYSKKPYTAKDFKDIL